MEVALNLFKFSRVISTFSQILCNCVESEVIMYRKGGRHDNWDSSLAILFWKI